MFNLNEIQPCDSKKHSKQKILLREYRYINWFKSYLVQSMKKAKKSCIFTQKHMKKKSILIEFSALILLRYEVDLVKISLKSIENCRFVFRSEFGNVKFVFDHADP